MNQIIKENIEFFNEFITTIGIQENNYIVLNETIYKKAEYTNLIKPFFEKLIPYYHKSKHFYLTREINFANFITVVRQICKKHNTEYMSKIKYSKSCHYMEYYIFI